MFIFVSIAFKVELSGADGLQLLPLIRQYFSESFRVESIKHGDPDAYTRNFGQALSNDPSAVKRFQKPPLPFAFKLHQTIDTGGSARIELVLNIAGSAVNDIGCYVRAVKRLFSNMQSGTGLKIKLNGIYSASSDGTAHLLEDEDGGGISLIHQDDLLPLWNLSGVHLDFISPLRVVKGKTTVRELDFPEFIRPLIRRITSLAYYYCGEEYALDFRRLSSDSARVTTFNKGLAWRNDKGSGSGLLGKVAFRGDLQEYLGFILLGERFNLGKGASYGSGGYRVDLISDP